MVEIRHKDTGGVLIQISADRLQGAKVIFANLSNADLQGADLSEAILTGTDLTGATLLGADLTGAKLASADLSGANLSGANLTWADLCQTNLSGAALTGTSMSRVDLSHANLSGTDWTDAAIGFATFGGCPTLAQAKGLDKVRHWAPSSLDIATLRACVNDLPDAFLDGCGLTRHEIENLRAMYRKGIRFYSCFLSHGEPDLPFAERLLADLRQANVSCWHYKDSLFGGEEWEHQVNRAIKVHDKLLLVCSRSANYRPNVVKEVVAAIRDERETGRKKLFPVRLDDSILEQKMLDDELRHVQAGVWSGLWVEDVRRMHIPDFSGWETDHVKYKREFERLLEALKASG